MIALSGSIQMVGLQSTPQRHHVGGKGPTFGWTTADADDHEHAMSRESATDATLPVEVGKAVVAARVNCSVQVVQIAR